MRAAARRAVAVAFALALLGGFFPAPAQIAVIVHKSNPVRDLTLADLQRLYLGRQTTFANGLAVVLGEYRPARHAFYRATLNMNETAVSRHWISVVFSERNATPPREFRTAEEVRRFVTTTPGAICFLDLASVSDDLKVVTVEGRRPQDPEYPLR